MQKLSELQIGKNGLTENFINTLRDHFKKHKNVKIRVLKSAGHDKQKVREMADKILDKLGKGYIARTIGFTIALKKSRGKR